MSGNGGRQEGPPKDLNSLYKLCVAATPPQPTQSQQHGQPLSEMSEEDKKFLSEALDSLNVDPIKRMRECLTVLQTANDGEEGIESKQAALKELTDWCNQIDFASDFHKIGGFASLRNLLGHEDPNLRALAYEMVGTLAQNNPYCQNKLLEDNFFPQLLWTIDNDPDNDVKTKALFATSCLARDVPEAQKVFLENDGLSVLMRAMQSEQDRLKTKAAFMLGAMCRSLPACKDTLVDMGMVEQLVGMLGGEHSMFHEHLMSALLDLVTNHPRALAECQRPELELPSLLRNRLSLLDGKEANREEHEYADSLLQMITSDGETVQR